MVSLSHLFGSFIYLKKIYCESIISPALLRALVISLEQGISADETQFCIYLGLTLSEANLDGVTLVGYKRF